MLSTLGRTAAVWAAVVLAMRLMGKRQLSQLQASELAVALLVSEVAVLPLQDPAIPLWRGFASLGALVLLELSASWLMLRWGGFRRAVCGRPAVVIQRGKLLQGEMRRLRLTAGDLLEQLRQAGVFSLEEVAWAVVETNGSLSVLTGGDSLEVAVVADGELSRHSLGLCGKDEAWARRQLAARGLNLSQVFLMTATPQGRCRVIPREGAPGGQAGDRPG